MSGPGQGETEGRDQQQVKELWVSEYTSERSQWIGKDVPSSGSVWRLEACTHLL